MYKSKMMIVMRRDLKMRKGKIAAQAGHACIDAVLMALSKEGCMNDFEMTADGVALKASDQCITPLSDWFLSGCAKVCVYVDSEEELLAIAQKAKEKGMLVQAFSPLGCGAVLGDETLGSIAKKYNKSVAQICLRFVLQSGINVLTKSVTPARIIENAEIFDFELTAEDMAVISAMPEVGFTGWLPENAPADAIV